MYVALHKELATSLTLHWARAMSEVKEVYKSLHMSTDKNALAERAPVTALQLLFSYLIACALLLAHKQGMNAVISSCVDFPTDALFQRNF
jgi:hypothetical protein